MQTTLGVILALTRTQLDVVTQTWKTKFKSQKQQISFGKTNPDTSQENYGNFQHPQSKAHNQPTMCAYVTALYWNIYKVVAPSLTGLWLQFFGEPRPQKRMPNTRFASV